MYILVALVFLWAEQSFATPLPLPTNLADETLSENVPTAFAPNNLTTEDFTLEWVGEPIPKVEVTLEKNSLEWVRVVNIMVLPRARLITNALEVQGGRVTNSGFSQALEIPPNSQGRGKTNIPILLISGDTNLIDVTVLRQGKEIKGKLRVRFKPLQPSTVARVYTDPSCSYFGVSTHSIGFKQDEWVYIGCRMVDAQSENYRTASLEMFVFWDNVGQSIKVGGVDTPATSSSVWGLRQKSSPGYVRLGAGQHAMTVRYRIPEVLHRGSLGLGIGPYSFSFRGNGEDIAKWIMMPTLYASYFITDSMRLVAFDATTLSSHIISDFGIYLNSEYARTVDRRVAIYLMLGAHAIGFWSQDQYYLTIGAPQGAEVIITDFLMRSRNLSFGGFIYPEISGKSYYNTWIRWGSSRLFLEFNYIAWMETINEQSFASRSMGLTIGFPLPFMRFL